MDASLVIAGWKRRLVALAERSSDVFVDTPQRLIDDYRVRQRTFFGFTERQVANAEAELGVRFPLVFREYLLEMGDWAAGLFAGSMRVKADEFHEFRLFAQRMLWRTDASLALPREAVVFITHQGYTFLYVLGSGGFDGPVMEWSEGRREPRVATATFERLVESELELKERNNADAMASGGYYLTLWEDGSSRRWRPALGSGERRPLG